MNGDVMKTLLTILIAVAMVTVLIDPASAIDRSKKDKPKPKPERPAVDKPTNNQTRTVPDSKATKNTDSRKKNYDDFVDRNNNGIDDRVEKTSKNTSASKEPDSSRSKTPPEKPKP